MDVIAGPLCLYWDGEQGEDAVICGHSSCYRIIIGQDYHSQLTELDEMRSSGELDADEWSAYRDNLLADWQDADVRHGGQAVWEAERDAWRRAHPVRWRMQRARHAWQAHLLKHGLFARDFSHRRLYVWRRQRAAAFSYELHNHESVVFVSIGWARARRHVWWATSVTFYLSHDSNDMRLFSKLWRWMPNTGYRAYGSSWMPLRPWKGGLAESKRRQRSKAADQT